MNTRGILPFVAGLLGGAVAATTVQPAAEVPIGASEGVIIPGVHLTTGVRLPQAGESDSPSAPPESTVSNQGPQSNFSVSGQLPSDFMLDRTGQIIQAR